MEQNHSFLTLSDHLNGETLEGFLAALDGKTSYKKEQNLAIFHSSVNNGSLKLIATSNFFIGLRQLLIENYSSIESLVPLIVASKNLEDLQYLSLRSCQNINLEELSDLMKCDVLKNLKRLDLSETLITGDIVEALAISGSIKQLEDLNLGNCFKLKSTAAFDTLFDSDNVRKLKKLTLTNLPIEDDALLGISYSDKLTNLEYLDIGFCSLLKDFGVESFFFSRNCQKIKVLSLENTKITAKLLKEITKSEFLTNIQEFNLHECYKIAAQGFQELFSKGGHLFKNLEKLALSLTKIDSEGVLALAKNENIRKLRVLKLFDVPNVNQESLISLLESPIMETVTHLDLTLQAMNQTILKAMANSAYLKNLAELTLSRCPFLESAGINIFINSENALKLNVLYLAMTGVDVVFLNEASRLMESRKLANLRIVDIRKCEKMSHEEKLKFYLNARRFGVNVFTEYGFK